MANRGSKIAVAKISDINAESLLAELLSNAITPEQLTVYKESGFRKLFRNDIDSVELTEDDNDRLAFTINLNRDSIYDVLPEGLFHQPLAGNMGSDLNKMVADSRRLREEEKKARLFFKPFDQEMVMYATKVEQQERSLMRKILSGNIADDPYSFWNIPTDVPKLQANLLSGIMPWAYLIKGNLELTAKSIELLLNKKVTTEKRWQKQQTVETKSKKLEELTLGEDTVLGFDYWEGGLTWIFWIHDVLPSDVELFTKTGYLGKLLSYFTDIFLPIEIDVQFEYETQKSTTGENTYILGYGFFI